MYSAAATAGKAISKGTRAVVIRRVILVAVVVVLAAPAASTPDRIAQLLMPMLLSLRIRFRFMMTFLVDPP